MNIDVKILLTIISVVAAVVFGYIAYIKSKEKDDKSNGKNDGILLTEVGYIKSGIDDIKNKQEKQDERYIDLSNKVAAVNESVKSAHHRIDKLESEFGKP